MKTSDQEWMALVQQRGSTAVVATLLEQRDRLLEGLREIAQYAHRDNSASVVNKAEYLIKSCGGG